MQLYSLSGCTKEGKKAEGLIRQILYESVREESCELTVHNKPVFKSFHCI